MDFEGEHQGKVALVLGGSRGIGAAIVERLALDGAKAAVAALVKGGAIALGSRGITVNNIQPGPTDTDILSFGQ